MPDLLLDVRSLVFVMVVICITLSLALTLFWYVHKDVDGPAYWALGMLSISIGALLIGLRDQVPQFASIVLANSIYLSGYALFSAGIRAFFGIRGGLAWEWVPLSAIFFSFLYFTYIEHDLIIRIILFSVAGAILMYRSAYLLYRNRLEGRSEILGLAVCSLLLLGIGLTIRAGLYMFQVDNPGRQDSFLSSHIITTLTILIMDFVYITLSLSLVSLPGLRAMAELEKSKKAAEQMARRDFLTGLNNRLAFSEQAKAIHAQSLRFDRTYSFMMIDLDYFKQVNDTQGHDTGDEALTVVAQVLSRHSREVDVKGRIGGEEFALVLPETTLEAAAVLANRIRAAIASEPVQTADQVIYITASIGVAESNSDDADFKQVMSRADEALYLAKSNGRNRVETYQQA